MRSRYAITLFSLGFALVVLFASVTKAQPPELPADLTELTTSEFIALADAIVPVRSADAEDRAALRQEAARRLTDTDAATTESLANINELFRFGRSELDAEAQATLLAAIQSRTSSVASLALADFQTRFFLEAELSRGIWNPGDSAQLVADWVAGNDTSGLDANQLVWLIGRMNVDAYKIRAFRVTWTGQITPPATGEYTFSVSPHNVNVYDFDNFYYKQSMQVTVGGEQVVNATDENENWNYEGEPINLTAGQSVPLVVEFAYEVAQGDAAQRPGGRPIQTDRSPHAVLQWKGPGFSTSTVDASALTLQGTGDPGIEATYTLIDRGANENTTITVTEPHIDHAWMGGAHFVTQHAQIEGKLIDQLWELAMAPAYWDACVAADTAEEPLAEHVFIVDDRQAARMTAARRVAFLTELLNRPAIMDRLTLKDVFDLYNHYRYGAEDEAIAVLGEWMQRHPHAVPEPAASIEEFWHKNRSWCRNLTISSMWIYPEHFTILESDYLELPDGSCCLPVAYVLAYGHHEKGEIMDWINALDARLDDDSLTGDKRVNWLIARAMAEEIRRNPASPFARSDESLLSGMEWLEEASLTAVSPEAKQRVAIERAARFATKHLWDLSLEAMQPYAATVPDWPARIEALQLVLQGRAERQANRNKRDLIKMLTARKVSAAARGDSAKAAEFQSALDDLTNE